MYNYLDNIESDIYMLYQELESTENEETKKYLQEAIKEKQKQYTEAEKRLIKEIENN